MWKGRLCTAQDAAPAPGGTLARGGTLGPASGGPSPCGWTMPLPMGGRGWGSSAISPSRGCLSTAPYAMSRMRSHPEISSPWPSCYHPGGRASCGQWSCTAMAAGAAWSFVRGLPHHLPIWRAIGLRYHSDASAVTWWRSPVPATPFSSTLGENSCGGDWNRCYRLCLSVVLTKRAQKHIVLLRVT
jgi:hypothetical protein